MGKSRFNKAAGSSTLMILSVIAVLAMFTAGALDYSMTLQRQSLRINLMQRACSIGDGSLQYSFGIWREICRLNSALAMPVTYFSSVTPPPASYFPDVSNYTASTSPNTPGTTYTVSNFQIQALDPQWNILPSGSAPTPCIGANNATQSFYYLASADVTLPASGTNVRVGVRRIFEKQVISPWNWAIFYIDPLEIQPGPAFTVTGWVHTNSNLYTGHSSLTFASKVTYSDDWVIGFAPGDSSHSTETPASPNYPANLPPAMCIAQQPFGLDSSRIFSNTDANDNNDSYHELIERANPNYSDPLAGMRFSDQAGVTILIDANNNVTIYNQSGTQISGASNNPQDKQLFNTIKGALQTNTTIQDNREQASVRIATLDLSKVYNDINTGKLASVGNGTASGFNQIIYISDTSASSTARRGIKLINGAKMPNQGLTVASNNPVYLQGDFNTGGVNGPGATGPAGPASNNASNPTSPTVNGYTRQPCLIASDAINVLSNAWTDPSSTQSLSVRVASNTTINAAFLAGIVPSANGNYSGGAENFPRFLEDWTNKTFTYYGSMVELYSSTQATGIWGQSNVYGAPTRQWYFDTGFRQMGPPGSLMIYSYNNQRWFLQ